MSHSTKAERRALSADEFDLVQKSHHPQIKDLDDKELPGLLKLVRERRDRAQSEAHRKRREMRRKADPRGASPASKDTGTRIKAEVLAMAVRRLNGEVQRRKRLSARAELVENARKALDLRQATRVRHHPKPGRTRSKGMAANPNTKAEDLARPMEVGRVSQFVKNAQAKRDKS